ncbi:MAG TPA: NADH-quinone oxidoreductase subunit C, partial [Glycomyces sp.]|nr:NADH-quinone oxidoreductase subunit C [Glycomyces sp.]
MQPVGQEAQGLFGVSGSGDTSGFGGLVRPNPTAGELVSTPEPLGGYFDEVLASVREAHGPEVTRAVVLDRGELTIY